MNKTIKIIVIMFSLIALDILTKMLFYGKHFFIFNYIENKGLIFGLNLFNPLTTILLTLIFIIIWIILLIKSKKEYSTGIIFILAGLVSNLLNRIFLGYVIDFIDIKIISIFNLADVFIIVGVILLIWRAIKK